VDRPLLKWLLSLAYSSPAYRYCGIRTGTQRQLAVSHASREGARIGVVGAVDELISQRTMDAAGTLVSEKVIVEISPSPSERLRGAQLTVRVKYPVDIRDAFHEQDPT